MVTGDTGSSVPIDTHRLDLVKCQNISDALVTEFGG